MQSQRTKIYKRLEKLADLGFEKIGENLPEIDNRGLEQVKPGPLDPMGSYTGAADLYESPSTQAPNPTGATGAASQHSQTADLFGPNPIGSGAETFEPEPGEVGPNPRTFEQP